MKYKKQQVISVLLGSPIGTNRIFIVDPATGKELASISQDGIISGQEYRINIDGKFKDISESLRKIIDVNKQFNEIKDKIKDLNSSLSTTNTQVHALEGTVATILAWETALELRINPILANVGVLDAAVTALQGEMTALQGRVTTCETTLGDHENRIGNLEDQIGGGDRDISVDRLVDGSLQNKACTVNVYEDEDYELNISPYAGIVFQYKATKGGGDITRFGNNAKNDKFVVINKEGDGEDLCGLTADGRVFARDGFYLWNNNKNEFRKEIPATYLGSGSLSINDAIIEISRCVDGDGKVQCLTLIGNEIGLTHQHMREEALIDAVIIGHKDKNNQFAIYDYENIHGNQGTLIAQIAHDGVIWGYDYLRWDPDTKDFEKFFLSFEHLRSGRLKAHTLLTINDGLSINTENGIEHIINNNTACRIGCIDQPNRYLVIGRDGNLLSGIDSDGIVYARMLYLKSPNSNDWLTLDQVPIKPEQIIDGDLKTTNIYAKKYFVPNDKDGWREFKECQCEDNNQIAINDVQDGNIEHKYMFYNKMITTPEHRLNLQAHIDKTGIKETYTDLHDGTVNIPVDDVRIGDENKPNQFIVRNKQTGVIDSTISETGVITGRGFGVINSITGQPSASIDNDGNIVCRSINTTEEGGGDTRYNKHPVFHKVEIKPEEGQNSYDSALIIYPTDSSRPDDPDFNIDPHPSLRLCYDGGIIASALCIGDYFTNQDVITSISKLAGIRITSHTASQTTLSIKLQEDDEEEKQILRITGEEIQFLGNVIADKDGIVGGAPGEGNKNPLLHSIKIMPKKDEDLTKNAFSIETPDPEHPDDPDWNSMPCRLSYDGCLRINRAEAWKLTAGDSLMIGDHNFNEDPKINATIIDDSSIKILAGNELEDKEGEIYFYARRGYLKLNTSNTDDQMLTDLFEVDGHAIKFWGNTIANKDGIVRPASCMKCERLEDKINVLETKLQEQDEKINLLMKNIK